MQIPMPRKGTPAKLLLLQDELKKELKKGKIFEADVRWKNEPHIFGVCVDNSMVFVNPAPALVETLLHELLHRRYPRMSEKRVDAAAKTLLYHLTDRELRQWFRAYGKLATKRVTPLKLDSDE